ncbi:hypothetical protein B0H13DRAFT_2291082 [Mycena leptocephala]|nr:hypothetical protein B0H13DRAFT_2291082 [Mycena leptocephala]
MTTRSPPAKLVVAASRTLPANPQLYDPPVYQADTVAPSLASGTTTHTQKLLRNCLLRTAQFCAVTGSASESIQACYVLNTVRKRKGESTEEAQARRVAVEDFLMDCGILKVLPRIHNSWNTYASVFFCPERRVIEDLTIYFQICNTAWQYQADQIQSVSPKRPLFEGGAKLLLRHFNFYVINPTGFLPNGEPLAVCTSPPRLDEDHPMIAHVPTWSSYCYDLATSQLVPVAGNAVPLVISLPYDLSTVSVIINANEKIEHAQRSGWILSNNVSALKVAIEAFLQEFFFLPLLNVRNSRRTGSDSMITQDVSIGSVLEPMEDAKEGTSLDPSSSAITLCSGMTPAPDRMEEAAPGLGSDGDGSVYEDEDEELEESDDDRTLPTEEFWEGLQKVKDPTIPINVVKTPKVESRLEESTSGCTRLDSTRLDGIKST